MKEFSDRQKEIIVKAINIISEKGIQDLTMKNIAENIGVTEPAIYRHFENKRSILLGILDFYHSKVADLKEKSVSEKGSIEKIRTYITAHYENFHDQPAVASILFAEEIFRSDRRLSEKIREIMGANEKYITDVIKTGISQKEIRADLPVEHLCMIIMGSFRLLVSKWKGSGHKKDLLNDGEKLWETIYKVIKG